MKELDEIKNRIQNRRGSSQEVVIDVEEVEKKYSKPSKIYKISMFVLVVMAMFLSVAVYAKKDENGKFLEEKLGVNINFASFNKVMNNLLNFWVAWLADVPYLLNKRSYSLVEQRCDKYNISIIASISQSIFVGGEVLHLVFCNA